MQASVVIPVWNGLSVIAGCLDSVYAYTGDELLEVICVDNASTDGSSGAIATRYPEVRLLRQPANLGFAGGVNAGIDVAQGDLFALLNQDCLVHEGWLTALIQALEECPEFGIAGCTMLNADGTVNHAGAVISRPDAYGVHLVEVGEQPTGVDFATGAALAIRRQTWDAVGRFDEGFYPGYYEDSDYCYRARRKGIETAHVPAARVTHLFSSPELEVDPVRYIANQHRSRYRFVSKHLSSAEVGAFFDAEYAAIVEEKNLHHALGRVIAARDAASGLADILERRRYDLGEAVSVAHRRQLQVGFTSVMGQSFATAEELSQVGLLAPPLREWQAANRQLEETLSEPLSGDLPVLQGCEEDAIWQALASQQERIVQQAEALQEREHVLLTRIHFRSPDDDQPEPKLRRLLRLLVLRPLSFLVGRDYLLLSELNAVHVARLDLMNHGLNLMSHRLDLMDQGAGFLIHEMDQIYRAAYAQMVQSHNARIEQVNGLYRQRAEQNVSLFRYYQEQLERRLKILETLAKHD